MTRPTRRRNLAAATAAVLALAPAIAACGGDDTAATSTTSGTSATTTAPASTPAATAPASGTATSGTGTSGTVTTAELRDRATAVGDQVQKDVQALLASTSVAQFQQRADDLGATLRDGATQLRDTDVPARYADERDRAAMLLDRLRTSVSDARDQATGGDLTGALAALAASAYRQTVAALRDLQQSG